MDKSPKIAHLLGLALLMYAKHVSVLVLTLPGLGLALATGIVLMLRRGMTPNRLRWMAVKLALVAVITANAALVLAPAGRDMAAAAREGLAVGGLPARFAALEAREGAFGAANLLMTLAVIALAVVKPSLRARVRP